METAAFQHFIDRLGELDPAQQELLSEALTLGGAGEALLEMIDTRFATAPACGHCGGQNPRKWGNASGLKRYRCKECGRTFNALTGTPMAQLHRREAWLAYAGAMCKGLSLRKAAAECGIDLTTSFRWRHRFLQAQKDASPDQLQGIVEADEAFFFKISQGVSQAGECTPKTRQ